LLDSNKPPVPLVLPRVGALGKRQPAPEPKVEIPGRKAAMPPKESLLGK